MVALDSPADETKGPQLARSARAICQSILTAPLRTGMGRYEKLRKWSDANTGDRVRTCMGESLAVGSGISFHVKFNEAGKTGKIVKTHQISKRS